MKIFELRNNSSQAKKDRMKKKKKKEKERKKERTKVEKGKVYWADLEFQEGPFRFVSFRLVFVKFCAILIFGFLKGREGQSDFVLFLNIRSGVVSSFCF